MFKKRKNDVRAKEILKEAYKLGFEVGYYRHYESVGWVRRRREELEHEAAIEEISSELVKAYERGKVDGERKKSKDMLNEKKIVAKTKHTPAHGMEAISIPDMEPKFFRLPRFLRKKS